MFSMLSLSLILIFIQSSRHGLGEAGVVTGYRDVYKGIENKGQCFLQGKWYCIAQDYALLCVECSNEHLAIVYYDNNPLDGVTVQSCDVVKSITVIPPESKEVRIHSVQYQLTSGQCVRRDLTPLTGWMYSRKESECTPVRQATIDRIRGYSNGWKKAEKLSLRGIVRDVISLDQVLEKQCKQKDTWNNKDKRFTMKCFDCSTEYVAILYYKEGLQSKEIKMGAATVETCKSGPLKQSVSIVPDKSATEFRVQYKQNSDQCLRRNYVLQNYMFREIVKPQCLTKPTWSLSELGGYRNGWKRAVV